MHTTLRRLLLLHISQADNNWPPLHLYHKNICKRTVIASKPKDYILNSSRSKLKKNPRTKTSTTIVRLKRY